MRGRRPVRSGTRWCIYVEQAKMYDMLSGDKPTKESDASLPRLNTYSGTSKQLSGDHTVCGHWFTATHSAIMCVSAEDVHSI
jgi:hypothetical protein